MAFAQAVLANPVIPREERQAALDRIYTAPSIPEELGTTSPFWLKTPHPELHDLQSDLLPTSADVVIIGSGITATSVAKTLLTSEEAANLDLRIVLLEARDICSGATGRNGGHCLETAEEYLELKETWGQESAQKLVRFRMKHMDALMATAKAYRIVEEAQVRRVQFLSAHFDEESWKYAQASVEAFRNDMPEEYKEMDLGVVDDHDEICVSLHIIPTCDSTEYDSNIGCPKLLVSSKAMQVHCGHTNLSQVSLHVSEENIKTNSLSSRILQ